MSALQESKTQADQRMLLHLMSTIEKTPVISQRTLAAELGIALGLMNAYIKKCVKKGWLKATQIPAKRLSYFITPEGFNEKSRLVTRYLANSLAFFRHARVQCEAIFMYCREQNWTKVGLIGEGDLAEIARLVAHGIGINVESISIDADFNGYDAVLITDVQNPQSTFDALNAKIQDSRLLTLDLLHISRQKRSEGGEI